MSLLFIRILLFSIFVLLLLFIFRLLRFTISPLIRHYVCHIYYCPSERLSDAFFFLTQTKTVPSWDPMRNAQCGKRCRAKHGAMSETRGKRMMQNARARWDAYIIVHFSISSLFLSPRHTIKNWCHLIHIHPSLSVLHYLSGFVRCILNNLLPNQPDWFWQRCWHIELFVCFFISTLLTILELSTSLLFHLFLFTLFWFFSSVFMSWLVCFHPLNIHIFIFFFINQLLFFFHWTIYISFSYHFLSYFRMFRQTFIIPFHYLSSSLVWTFIIFFFILLFDHIIFFFHFSSVHIWFRTIISNG